MFACTVDHGTDGENQSNVGMAQGRFIVISDLDRLDTSRK